MTKINRETELKKEIEKLKIQKRDADNSWAVEGYMMEPINFNNIFFSDFLFKKYPIILSKHCSNQDMANLFEEYIKDNEQHKGIDLIRHLTWQYLLHKERNKFMSEELLSHYISFKEAELKGFQEGKKQTLDEVEKIIAEMPTKRYKEGEFISYIFLKEFIQKMGEEK